QYLPPRRADTHGSILLALSPTIIRLLCLRIIPVHGRDLQSWEASCAKMLVAGIRRVPSYNPYWEVQGQTFLHELGGAFGEVLDDGSDCCRKRRSMTEVRWKHITVEERLMKTACALGVLVLSLSLWCIAVHAEDNRETGATAAAETWLGHVDAG